MGNVVGSAVLSDTATRSGGFMVAAGSPTPTITFTLIAPDNSTGHTKTHIGAWSGDDSSAARTTTGSNVATQVGLYYWNVSYNANGSPFDTNASHSGQNDTDRKSAA